MRVPSVPSEFRGAFKLLSNKRLTEGTQVSILNILDIHINEKFTTNQKLYIQDYLNSNLSLDTVTCFSLRPPLLLVVRKLIDYFSHLFFLRKVERDDLTQELSKTPQPWIDGSFSIVKIRYHSFPFINDLLTMFLDRGYSSPAILEPKFILDHIHFPIYFDTFVSKNLQLSKSPL